MSRPVYETREDRFREADVAAFIGRAWGFDVVKLPKMYPCDYALMRGGKTSGWLEIKVRNASYPTYMISALKWKSGLEIAQAFHRPFVLAVSWPVAGEQVVMACRVTPDLTMQSKLVVGGRRDRGVWQDVEPMVEIPMSAFKRVEAA